MFHCSSIFSPQLTQLNLRTHADKPWTHDHAPWHKPNNHMLTLHTQLQKCVNVAQKHTLSALLICFQGTPVAIFKPVCSRECCSHLLLHFPTYALSKQSSGETWAAALGQLYSGRLPRPPMLKRPAGSTSCTSFEINSTLSSSSLRLEENVCFCVQVFGRSS